ncbi:MAG TPA: hypothetical protein HPQ04_10010, partial [Rhodospirillaceae bacterium]|nr:hypothetical protein [Rhodospirillaceae bacterium]
GVQKLLREQPKMPAAGDPPPAPQPPPPPPRDLLDFPPEPPAEEPDERSNLAQMLDEMVALRDLLKQARKSQGEG